MTPAVRSAFLRLLGFESTTHAFPTLKGVYFKSSIAFELITTKGLRVNVTWDSYSRQPAVAITLQLTNQVLPHKTNVHSLQTKLLIQAVLKNNVLYWTGDCRTRKNPWHGAALLLSVAWCVGYVWWRANKNNRKAVSRQICCHVLLSDLFTANVNRSYISQKKSFWRT